jgi:hypothetical protein
LLATDAQVRTCVESIAGDFFSGLQHSSGARRIALDVRSPSPVRAASHRISHIDTLLPGMRVPLAVRTPPFAPAPSGYVQPSPPVAPIEPDNCPPIAVTPGAIEPFGPKRRIRTAYIVGTFMGLGLSLGFSVLSTQLNSRPTSAASPLAPGQILSAAPRLSQGATDEPALREVNMQDSGVGSALRSADNAFGSPKAKARAAPGATRDPVLVNSKNPKQLSTTASPAGNSDNAKPIASKRNRWGI